MTKPDSLEDSLGLEYLTNLSELIIRQEVKLIESEALKRSRDGLILIVVCFKKII